MELLLPEVRPPRLALPSYVKLDMAFGVGSGGQLFDKSRYRSHGAINGPEWAAGLHGACLDFDSTVPDYVLIPAARSTQLNFIAEDFSVIARVNIDSLLAHNWICCRGVLSISGWDFFARSDGILRFATNQAAATQQTDSALGAITTGAWLTLGFSRSGAAVQVYRNGVDITTVPAVHINPLTSLEDTHIGIRTGLTQALDGKMEFLRVFGGVALTASEHLAWHRALA